MQKRSVRTKLRAILAANMRSLRDEQSLSQEALGDRAELHRTFIGDLENCRRNVSIDNVEKIADALGIEPWQLLQPIR